MRLTNYFKLDGKTPVAVSDMVEWAAWYETAGEERVVDRTYLDTIVFDDDSQNETLSTTDTC